MGSPRHLCIDPSEKPILFKIDSGTDVTLISRETHGSRSQLPRLRKPNVVLRSVGAKLDCVGVFRATVRHWRETHTFDVYLVDGNTRSLLGRDVAEKMHLIRRCKEVSTGVDIDPDVFGELGHMKCEPVRLKLKEGAEPHCEDGQTGADTNAPESEIRVGTYGGQRYYPSSYRSQSLVRPNGTSGKEPICYR